ncbi:MAG: ferrous iron transport protein A [Tissierellia bacterium]|nr:ferrous iron transport protein A [Tissierellia bacterium]
MNENLLTLNQLPIGSIGKVKQLTLDGIIRRRMLDLGLIHNTNIKSLGKSPFGDPIAYEIRGATIALRSEEASKILVELIQQKE